MTVYFNEFDSFAAQWLRNLYPKATVDERDIKQVEAADLAGYERCHFFGGIGGWEYALELAGWSGPVWTGSCPCQPFSAAGKRKGSADARHVWPEFRRLIGECGPAIVLGEQVASKDGREWLAGVRADLEALGYAVGAADLCAASQGAPHIRQRLFWVADSRSEGLARWSLESARQERQATERSCGDGGMANSANVRSAEHEHDARERAGSGQDYTADGDGIGRLGDADGAQRGSGRTKQRKQRGALPATGSAIDGLAVPNIAELQRITPAGEQSLQQSSRGLNGLADAERDGGRLDFSQRGPEGRAVNQWANSRVVACRDEKPRRLSAQPGDEPLAYGIPRDLGRRIPELRSVAKSARSNRVGRLRGYGNAICPQVAAVFIRAFMEST